MKQLNHPKPSICLDAINGIRELVSSFSTHSLALNLNLLINTLKPHLINYDQKVRHGLYLLLKYLFQNVPSKQISPYMDILIAAVKCAITHINQSIQLSGVKTIDLLIANYPSLVQGYTYQLLPCYMPLVSLYSAKSKSKGLLNTSPNDLLVKHCSRFLIFKQILQLLTLEESNTQTTPTLVCAPPIVDVTNEVVWPTGNVLSCSLSVYEYFSSSNLLLKLSHPLRSGYRMVSEPIVNAEFFNQLVKLLMEYWIEIIQTLSISSHVTQKLSTRKRKNKHTSQSLGTVDMIIQLMCLILSLSSDKELFNKDVILTHFLPYFPLAAPAKVSLNLKFCYLLVLADSDASILHSVSQYFTKVVTSLHSNTVMQNLSVLANIIKKLNERYKNSTCLNSLYSTFVKLFISTSAMSSAKCQMLLYLEQLLDQHIQEQSLSDPLKQYFLYPCLGTLPLLLLNLTKPVDPLILMRILKLLNCSLSLNINEVQVSFVNNLPDTYSK